MARSPIPIPVIGPTGVVAGASVLIQKRNTSINSTVYADDTSLATLANPVITDASGRAVGWLERGAYQATISKVGFTTRTEYFDITPGSDQGIDTAWYGDSSVTKAKQAADTTPNIQIFTASGTYVKPTGAKLLLITAIGGGAGGDGFSGYPSADSSIPGGNPGSMIQAQLAATEVGSSVAITVGLGGAGGQSSNGSAGGQSRFGNTIVAAGGQTSLSGVAPSALGPGRGGAIGYYAPRTQDGFPSSFGQAGGAAGTSGVAGGVGVSGASGVPGGGGGSGFSNGSSSPTAGGNGGFAGGGGGTAVGGAKAGNGGAGIVVVVTL